MNDDNDDIFFSFQLIGLLFWKHKVVSCCNTELDVASPMFQLILETG